MGRASGAEGAGNAQADGSRTRAVVVHFGDFAVTRRLLLSLEDHAPRTEIAVVDNGGLDERSMAPFKNVVALLRPAANLGYGVACNLGARGSGREFLLFLNNDVRVLPGAVDELERALDSDPRAAAVGPRIFDGFGSVTASITRSPSPHRILFENLCLPRIFPGIPFFHGHHTVPTDHGRARPVESLLGAAFLFRRSAFESLGGFDPRYFFYCEESDLFRRARDEGWRVLFEPASGLVHEGGTSSQSVDRAELDRLAIVAFLTYAARFHGPVGEARTRRALRWGARLRWMLACLQPGEAGRQRLTRYRRILEMHRSLGVTPEV